MVCPEDLAIADCAQHTGTEGGLSVQQQLLCLVSSFQLCSCLVSMQTDCEVYSTGDETINFKLMTGFKVRLTRLSGVVMVAQLS